MGITPRAPAKNPLLVRRGTGMRVVCALGQCRPMRSRLICLGVLLCTAALTQPAAAQVQPAGTGEPLFTNSAQNTQWFEWPATSGADAYRVQYRYYANNAEVAAPTVNANLGAGSSWANWSGVATLQHGGQYGICAQGAYSLPNDSLYFSDGPDSCSMGTMLGRRAYTTIDRSRPNAAITLAGGAAYTRDAKIGLKVDFSDDVAGPFPANFVWFQYGGGPDGLCDNAKGFVDGYNAACSAPGAPASRPPSPARPTTARARARRPTAPCGPACGRPTPRSRTTRRAPTRAARRRRRTSPTRPATAWCSTAPRRPPRSPLPR